LKPSSLTQPQSVPSSNVSTFELLPKLKDMALIPPYRGPHYHGVS
jgi:hypothetical protein